MGHVNLAFWEVIACLYQKACVCLENSLRNSKKQRLMVAWNTMQLLRGVVCAFSRFVKQYCGYILESGYLERKYISHSKHSIIWMQLWPTEIIKLGYRGWEVYSRYDIPKWPKLVLNRYSHSYSFSFYSYIFTVAHKSDIHGYQIKYTSTQTTDDWCLTDYYCAIQSGLRVTYLLGYCEIFIWNYDYIITSTPTA